MAVEELQAAPSDVGPAPTATLTAEQVAQWLKLSPLQSDAGAEEAERFLADALSLPNHQTDARSSARVAFATYTLMFAQQAGHGPNGAASLLEVMHSLLEDAAAGAELEQLQATFKACMLARTSPKPGPNSAKFSPDQVAGIAQFFTATFFHHWRLYSHCLQHPQQVAEQAVDLTVETACVPSFAGAVPEDEWNAAAAAAEEARAAAAVAAAAAAKEAAEQAAAAAVAAAAEEAERRRLEDLAKKPATLEEAVEHLVSLRLEPERKALATAYAAKEEALLKRITELEAQVPGGGASTGKKKNND